MISRATTFFLLRSTITTPGPPVVTIASRALAGWVLAANVAAAAANSSPALEIPDKRIASKVAEQC